MLSILINLFSLIMIIVIIPLLLFTLYIKRYLYLKNGNSSKFRRVMYRLALANLLFLAVRTGTIFYLGFNDYQISVESISLQIISAIILLIAYWYAFFKTRQILKDELDGLIL